MPEKWSVDVKVMLAMAFVPAIISLLLFLPFRIMTWPVFLLTIILFYLQYWRGPKYLWVIPLGLAIILSFMPFDVSAMDLPGSPRFVPYVEGHIDYGSVEDESGADFVSSDLPIYGDDVKWIWVW